jgi:hypothetical protein
LFAEKTGWTPAQVRDLTIPQIQEYIKGWTRMNKKSSETKEGMDADDIKMFNLASGIKTIQRAKKP